MRTSTRRASPMRESPNLVLPLPRWILGYWQEQPRLTPRAPVVFLPNQTASRVPASAAPLPAAVAGTHDFQLSSHHRFGQECSHRAHVQLPRSAVLKRALCQGPTLSECGRTQFLSCCCRAARLSWSEAAGTARQGHFLCRRSRSAEAWGSRGLGRERDTRLLATFSHCVSASRKRRRKKLLHSVFL